jgi:hypothetical protein
MEVLSKRLQAGEPPTDEDMEAFRQGNLKLLSTMPYDRRVNALSNSEYAADFQEVIDLPDPEEPEDEDEDE